MPSPALDVDVTGSGVENLSPSNVWFISVDLTVLGYVPRPLTDPDHVLRAGWVALCDEFDIGLGTQLYCRAPIWINFEHTLWTPDPTNDTNGLVFTVVAPRLRYYFSPGVEAHIHVLAS